MNLAKIGNLKLFAAKFAKSLDLSPIAKLKDDLCSCRIDTKINSSVW